MCDEARRWRLNPLSGQAVSACVEGKLRLRAGLAVAGVVAVGVLTATAVGLGSGAGTAPAYETGAFAWVRPEALAPGWSSLRLPGSPARLPLPPGWRPARGDSGTRTAELTGPATRIRGYLNATPRQGRETLADWASFRVDHNRDEGERDDKLLAAARDLPFAGGATGSCILDSYRTISGHRYRELACIVAGHSATTVIVVAAPPGRWAAERSQLRRAIDGFTT